jgi:hypothetical protein
MPTVIAKRDTAMLYLHFTIMVSFHLSCVAREEKKRKEKKQAPEIVIEYILAL